MRNYYCNVNYGNYKHGLCESRLYKIWSAMKTRCNGMGRLYNENYSNRGIKVCDEWKNFMSFYNWSINNGYQEKLTLDRIDNDNNYEPNNCRFVNYSIQNSNKRKYIRLKRNI